MSACQSMSSELGITFTESYASLTSRQLARMVRKHESGVSKRLMDLERIEERSFGYWSPAVSWFDQQDVVKLTTALRRLRRERLAGGPFDAIVYRRRAVARGHQGRSPV